MSFKIASRLTKAAILINEIPDDKFLLLINRILSKLHLKDASFFSDEEEEQLLSLFGFSQEQLRIAIDACCYIFEQAAFTSTGPEPLFDILLEAGFDEKHAKVLGRSWASEAGEYIAKLKAQSSLSNMGFPSLSGVDYHLDMVLSQSQLSKQQEPSAIFEFTIDHKQQPIPISYNATKKDSVDSADTSITYGAAIGSGSSEAEWAAASSGRSITDGLKQKATVQTHASGKNLEKLSMEFNHSELYSFFCDLDKMQQQLDALNAT